MTSEFLVSWKGQPLGRIRLGCRGCTTSTTPWRPRPWGWTCRSTSPRSRTALGDFTGVDRRFQVLGEPKGILVVDDYAHHPAEIQATLNAAKSGFGRNVIAVFQPHRYTRTRGPGPRVRHGLLPGGPPLRDRDLSGRREPPIPGVHGGQIAEGVKEHGHKSVTYVPVKEDLVDAVMAVARCGDMVLVMGAGDIWKIGEEIVLDGTCGRGQARWAGEMIAGKPGSGEGGCATGCGGRCFSASPWPGTRPSRSGGRGPLGGARGRGGSEGGAPFRPPKGFRCSSWAAAATPSCATGASGAW